MNNISAISVPGYRITEVIHVSNRTTIYRALQINPRKSVIIKTLNAQYPQLKELITLKNEIIITQKLDHANIIKCYKLESDNNQYALILEDIGGISLHEFANSQPLELETFLQIAITITSILEFIHQHQIIHKDIKPKNIVINPNNYKIQIIDFSISCLLQREVVEIKTLRF